jgi:riboflavin transporter FmnP
MNSKTIATIAIFSALTVSLNPYISRLMIPAFYFGRANYTFMEIPIIAALFLFGPLVGVAIGLLGGASLVLYFPSPYNVPLTILAILCTELGVYLAYRIVPRDPPQQNRPSTRRLLLYATSLGILFRVGIMEVVHYLFGRYLIGYFIGTNLTDPVLISLIPLWALFYATQMLYTIPIGYYIARIVSRNLRVGNKL